MSSTRKIGDVELAAIGYGAMGIAGKGYGPSGNDEERFKVLDRLFELGCRHWDTASVYGDSEELIGKWFERTGNRDKIFLATKFGIVAPGVIRGDPEFVKSECEKSLKKLRTDHIDLYYQHRPAPDTPIEITVGAMAELVKEGKVKYLGLSEAPPNAIRRAQTVHPISALQVEFSPFALTLEQPGGALDVARQFGITIVAFSPTGRGLATGRYKSFDDFDENDVRRKLPRFSAENFPHMIGVANYLQEIATAHNATAAQVCIAWLLAQGNDIIPIPGSKQIKYVEENWFSKDIHLSTAEIGRIRELVDATNVHLGKVPRLPKALLDQTLEETPPLEK
ncbi:hypothetical protein BS47DRAFT_1336526 [Hydnum rufescens UP504]|uniref:NADP-dependent oxidoreductase domain-containing protein n=1 Tax=Hydnum rufescens UP504 TaxID=1448309 RepID=A0A9P6E282_9AGAM|nr:hypothetical protein BS47DRAFT_1336526 [Hydnum rufescens UP504]